jgi:hypothetical protein
MKTTNTLDTPAGRVVYIRAPRRLSPEQLVMALASMAEDDPRWLAFHQILDEELATAMLDTSNPEFSDAKIRHASGRVEAMSTLKQRLFDERRKPIANVKPERPARRATR